MVNMFSDNVEKKVPKNLKECYSIDNTSQNLWLWCERLEGWGKFLFWFIIVSGLITAIASSITVKEITKGIYYTYTDTETSFDFELFITALVSTSIYAFVEYCAYHVLALLISSLATMVQNTRITANIALYNVAKEEGILNKENESSYLTKKIKQTKKVKEDTYTKEDFPKDTQKETTPKQKTEDFLTEIKETKTADLELILKDQRELYSKEEIDIIEKELSTREDNI